MKLTAGGLHYWAEPTASSSSSSSVHHSLSDGGKAFKALFIRNDLCYKRHRPVLNPLKTPQMGDLPQSSKGEVTSETLSEPPSQGSFSTMRPILPKEEQNEDSVSLDAVPDARSSKRRCVSSACIPCRKRKSKASRPSLPSVALRVNVLLTSGSGVSVMAALQLVRPVQPCITPSASTTSTVITEGKVH